MGIPRFTSFVDNNFTGWSSEEIKGRLVVDGFSLCYNLYCYDWSHGGQYTSYRDNVTHFFISMTQSGISPIVVLDGVDFKEEKVKTIIKRRNQSVKSVHTYTASLQKRQRDVLVDGVLPPLTYRVFLMVMIELNVKFVVADGEGDVSIFELANAYSCPVLSKDSDFLMFKLTNGYIPLNRFHWEATPINAEVYYYQAFCSQMKLEDPDLRVIIPAVLGNDFISSVETDTFWNFISGQVPFEGRSQRHRISSLIQFVAKFECLDDFVDSIQQLSCLTNDQQDHLRKNIDSVQAMYSSEATTTLEKISKNTELRAFNSEELPEWILKQFRGGNFYCMEALVLGKFLLDIYIDDSTKPSCVKASLPIRQYIYGLSGFSLVTEICRDGLTLSHKGVHATTTIHSHPLPPLSHIPTKDASEREHLLCSMLGFEDDPLLLGMQNYWKLVMLATKFWFCQCNPSPHQVKALILNFVVYATCPEEVPKMHVEFEIPFQFIRSPRWMPLLHMFAEWQSTYGDVMSLNQLLFLPLDPISPGLLYDGKLVMFFALPENDGFLASRLPIDQKLYNELVEAVIPRPSVSHKPQWRRNTGGAANQPPRFRDSSSGRGGRGHHQGRGQRGGHDHGYAGREQAQEKDRKENAQWRPRGGRGGQRADHSQSQGRPGLKNSAEMGKESRGRRPQQSKAASAKSRSGRVQIVNSEAPNFAHANRFSSLADEFDSEESS